MELIYKDLTDIIIGNAIEVHKQLGPGLLEKTYQQCLAYELSKSKLTFEMELNLPVKYKNVQMSCGYRIDLLVENKIIIELKHVDKILPIHEAQLLTYLKLSNKKLGLIINFNQILLRDGIKRIVLENNKKSPRSLCPQVK